MVLRRGVLPQCPRAVEGAENATAGAKRFQPKAERNLPAEIYGPERPAASPGLQPCAVLRVVTRSRRLCGNLGVRARASQPGARQWLGDGSGPKDGPPVAGASRSVRGRLASGLRRLWSVAGGSRPTPLPSPMRQPCCRGRCSSRWGVRLPLPPSAAIRSRRTVALFASPQSWNIVRQPDSAMPAAAIRAGKHHAAWYTPLGCLKSATGGATAGEKSAALLWKYC